MKATWPEIFVWLTLNTYFEAQGEGQEGQIAVNQVVLNRVVTRGQGIIDVITADKQFSWYNGRDIPAIKYPRLLLPCASSVWQTFIRRMSGDTFHGADLYHADYVAPSWAKSSKVKFITVIGKHLFYREDRG